MNRPAGRRPAAGPGGGAARTSAPRPPGRFTARALVLGVVLLALVLSYVFPVRVYLAQQAEIAELRAAQAAQRAHIEELAAKAALWDDDEYISIQARKRLYFAEPGEILLVIVPDSDDLPPPGPAGPQTAAEQSGAWWETVWQSIESAN